MQRGRKERDAIGASSVPALKIGNEVMIGWNLNNVKKLYAHWITKYRGSLCYLVNLFSNFLICSPLMISATGLSLT